MADDWRATIFTDDSEDVADVVEHICNHEVPDEVRNRFGDDVAASPGDASVFLYADSEELAREAGQVAQEVFSRHDLPAELIVDCWDAAGGVWHDAARWSPADAAEARVHRAEEERALSRERGVALWQVRVHLPSRRDTAALAGQLTAAGTPVVRRRKVLIAGANSEDDVRELAETIRGFAPPSASIHVERTGGAISPGLDASAWMPTPPAW